MRCMNYLAFKTGNATYHIAVHTLTGEEVVV